jgi:hypothetical protein
MSHNPVASTACYRSSFLYSTVNSIFYFSYIDPDYLTSGLAVTAVVTVHKKAILMELPIRYLSICNFLNGWLTFGADTVEWMYRALFLVTLEAIGEA